jgi:predicted enzyme related to lactoylglutathione lyase
MPAWRDAQPGYAKASTPRIKEGVWKMLTTSRVATAPLSVVLPAKDIKRARDFWERIVGIETTDAPAPGYFMGKAGMGTQFLVYETPYAPTQATAAAFLVDDLDAVMADLRSRGLTFMDYDMPGLKTINGVAEMGPMGRGAWFVDSEGNTINVVQM